MANSTCLLVHVVWSTARRAPVIGREVDQSLHLVLVRQARCVRPEVLFSGAAVDHVHLIARVSPTISVARFVHRIKGASSFELNRGAPADRRLFWQAGYWAESVSPADVPALASYVRGQRDRHDDSHPSEAWQFAGDVPVALATRSASTSSP